ncbi:MAG: protein kinase [Byssovorax sp.]
MQPGEVVGERFRIERLARSGGMGNVYRAVDERTGEAVALKALQGNAALDTARFTREAELLSGLRHPGIVRYVAHGVGATGRPYLVMEWLDGEELGDRLVRAPLGVGESLDLCRSVAEALAVAHGRGIVHRDIKPGNLYLSGGEVGRCKILDFGIARVGQAARTATAAGQLMGTPGYMAPEQARGDPEIDARTDVFSLGCVLFECLTGRPAFVAEHVMGLLAKILLDEVPRVSELAPEVPASLDDLVARMMSKERDGRPRDGAAVVAELGSLGAMDAARTFAVPTGPESLTRREQRLLSVVMLAGTSAPGERTPAMDLFFGPDPSAATAPTLTVAEATAALAPCRAVVEARGGRAEALPGGIIVATLTGTGIATDQAAQAALCALGLRDAVPQAQVALATGRGEVAGRLPVGEAIDRAARLIHAHRDTLGKALPGSNAGLSAPGSTGEPRRRPVAVDEVTAGLLDARFEVRGGSAGLELWGERAVMEASRTVLGKPTICVGRDRELSTLSSIFAECEEEGIARPVLVTGPPGIGKSRVRDEFLQGIRKRSGPVEIWIARGDPMGAGSAFGLLGEALRSAAGIQAGEPIDTRQKKLRARVARQVPASEVGRISEFLGEMCGTPFPDGQSVALQAARRDAILMGDQMRRAWEDLLAAETLAQPVILLLEDLHWGDLPTVKLVDAALRRLKEQPLMVVAFGRPEVHALFPNLWGERNLYEIRLGALTRKASERLVRQILGPDVSPEVMGVLLERADGNAFYLEELIRTAASGNTGTLPETVLAMVEARLEGFETEARRLLRAGAIFGQTFWRGGLVALLGGASQAATVGEWLAVLEEREVIARSGESRFPDEPEYRFRHALFREAAYAMLTEADRTLGHRLAGRWLEQAGESDAMLLAEHLERGASPARAARWYRRAAEEALEGNDLDAAVIRAGRGLGCISAAASMGPSARTTIDTRLTLELSALSLRVPHPPGSEQAEAGPLHLLLAEAHRWRGKLADAEQSSLEAMAALPSGSPLWYRAASETLMAGGRLGHVDLMVQAAEVMLAQAPLEGEGNEAVEAKIVALARANAELLTAGRYEMADAFRATSDALIAKHAVKSPAVLARAQDAHARRALSLGDLGEFLRLATLALEGFERVSNLRTACTLRVSVGYADLQLGAYAEAEHTLREALASADRLGLAGLAPSAKENLGQALAGLGRWDEAEALTREAVLAFQAQGSRRMEVGGRIYLARMLNASGKTAAAEQEARAALAVELPPPLRAYALAALGEVLLAGGRSAEALAASAEAMSLLDALGTIEEGEALLRLVYAEALRAEGDPRAVSAILDARDRLTEQAGRIADPARRASFLEHVRENARTLALAAAWTARPAAPG